MRTKSVPAEDGRLALAGFFDVALHDVNASINCECAGEQIGRQRRPWMASDFGSPGTGSKHLRKRRNRCGVERLLLFTSLLSHGFPTCQV